jgi:TRAP-type C4-dicarboxylate transport system permease large subunit
MIYRCYLFHRNFSTIYFSTVQVRLIRAAEIRRIIEQIIEGLQGSYAEAAVAAAFASGAAAAAAAEAAAEAAQADKMLRSFQWQRDRSTSTCGSSLTKGLEAPSPTSISRNFRWFSFEMYDIGQFTSML